jgi:hypothetical protein
MRLWLPSRRPPEDRPPWWFVPGLLMATMVALAGLCLIMIGYLMLAYPHEHWGLG